MNKDTLIGVAIGATAVSVVVASVYLSREAFKKARELAQKIREKKAAEANETAVA